MKFKYHHLLNDLIHLIVMVIASYVIILFAIWWFYPSHIPNNFTNNMHVIDFILFILVSYVIWHPIFMEFLTWAISSNINTIYPKKPATGLKVAFITTIVPASESIDLLHKVLPAMVSAEYPHDTWLLDEGNDPEIKKICAQYGVKHFSRKGIGNLNTPVGKFTKTKGGNHNSWYEVEGNTYDIVAQIDTDFIPDPTFLTKTLGFFNDPNVAFVGTPQVYGNTQHSLVAKGAAEQLHNFYGPILRGLSAIDMSLMIGANHIVRVAALKDVNHYTAHITEDLITGMKLHANKWKSIYVPQALAIGEGPLTWGAYFTQQMRWAYGCMDILFHHTPKLFFKMGFKRMFYYLLLQQYYFSGLAMALSTAILIFYFLFGIRAANVDIFKFLVFYSSVSLIIWIVSIWLQRFHISWKQESELLIAGKIVSIAVLPIYFWAFLLVLFGRQLKYKVTPKGGVESRGESQLRLFAPHLIIGSICAIGLISSFFTLRQSPIMIFWAFSTAALMLITPFIEKIYSFTSQIYAAFIKFVKRFYFKNEKSENNLNSLLHINNKITRKEISIDILFLNIVVIISFIPYIHKISFYSDDWSFIGNFSVAQNKSIIGLFQAATTPNTFMRPMQNIYDAGLFYIFGTNPLGYQIVNALVFIAIVALFYLVLLQIRLPRIMAIMISVIFALLPNYSTDRFWYAAFQVNLSMLFFLISLYSGLKAISLDTIKTLLWKTISILALLLSLLSYEVVLPLILVNLFLFWTAKERLSHTTIKKIPSQAVFITINIIALLYLVIFKSKYTTRLGDLNLPGDVLHIVASTFSTNYVSLGVNLPYIFGEILAKYSDTTTLLIGLFLYMIIYVYIYHLFSKPTSYFPSFAFFRNLTLSGIIIFLLGYAIFYTNNKVGFSATGIDNRVAIAASLGIACTFVGGFGLLLRLIPSRRISKFLFSIYIALVGTIGFFIISTEATFWIKAGQQQQLILSDIHKHFPSMEKGSTLFLDGVCPYIGPGIVFESQWDLRGALQTQYNDESIKADIVTPRLQVKKDGIYTQIYTFREKYIYQYPMYIYNFKTKEAYPIEDEKSARSYFQTYNPDYNNDCPKSSAGNGVDIF